MNDEQRIFLLEITQEFTDKFDGYPCTDHQVQVGERMVHISDEGYPRWATEYKKGHWAVMGDYRKNPVPDNVIKDIDKQIILEALSLFNKLSKTIAELSETDPSLFPKETNNEQN